MKQGDSRALTGRTVSRAVARSRAVRAQVRRRRRRTAALLACLGACVGVPLAWSMADPARAVAEAAVNQAQDLAELLNARSPGARTQAELTKHARTATTERARPKIIMPAAPGPKPEAPTNDSMVDLLQSPPTPVNVAAAEFPSPLTAPPTLASIVGSTPGTPSGPVSPGGDQGGTHSYPSNETHEALTPVSAVPEPGTWTMMLVGFGLIGWRTNRRRSSLKFKRAAL